ncbi:UDP-N-acetylglucosamine 2-epimerase (non-hydrolyzing) [Candidatus Woesearchaeota archaeon]|nr:UDP-N-acetylglucosamine 2-epimerase (non-hydrolyzing) [Candidatus Woesearchaeota archaeon]
MKIISVVGTRPNFVKIASFIKETSKHNDIQNILVHTGQHYDEKMSESFFRELSIPKPDINLGIGSGSHAEQTAKIMIEFEKVLLKESPDLVVVVGDVNSTLACALTASKLNVKVAHIEAGLRSFDRAMPEEINRLLVDKISDYLFITERDAEKNLLNENIEKSKIFFVGNLMIDTLLMHKEKASNLKPILNEDYAVLTLHRPSNVDSKDSLKNLLEIINEIQLKLKILWPIHPRTKQKIESFNLNINEMKNLTIIEPLGYLEFMNAVMNSKFVLTDSGGIQEETTVLNIPCITLRENTERPITCENGTNYLTGIDKEIVINTVNEIFKNNKKEYRGIELWDGKAAERIVSILKNEI